MARTYRSLRLAVLRDNEREMAALFTGLASSVAAEVLRYADSDGSVPRDRTWRIQAAIGALIMRLFVGRGRNGQDAPYEMLADGTAFALAPYPRVLLRNVEAAALIEAQRHANLMRRYVPDGLARQAAIAGANMARRLPAQAAGGYASPLRWIDPAGRTLSDRIWRTGGITRRKLDALLDDMLAEGRGSTEIAREVERFLQPGRNTIRTNKPYGRDASFDAMRLARTEIATSAGEAGRIGAAINPFVAALDWRLSGSHPRLDICDDLAAGGPYAPETAPMQPAHPQCLCYWVYVIIGELGDIIDQLRAEIQAGGGELLDVSRLLLNPDQFTRALMTHEGA